MRVTVVEEQLSWIQFGLEKLLLSNGQISVLDCSFSESHSQVIKNSLGWLSAHPTNPDPLVFDDLGTRLNNQIFFTESQKLFASLPRGR